MSVAKRKCRLCGRMFRPEKPHYRFCPQCYASIAPMGDTHAKRRPGVPDRVHGGVSRLWAGPTIVLRRSKDTPADRPSDTTRDILRGFEAFLTEIHKQHLRLSQLLKRGGLSSAEIKQLREGNTLDTLMLHFCPKFREWLVEAVGVNATDVVIDFYGLYGEVKRSDWQLAKELGWSANRVIGLRKWALKQLRVPEKLEEIEQIAVAVARQVLSATHDEASWVVVKR